MEPQLIRVADAARSLSLGRSTAYQLVASGELPAVRVGRSLRVPVEELRAWVRRRASASAVQPEARE